MSERENFIFSVDVDVSCSLTEEEKNKIILKMKDVLEEVLQASAKNGTINICSPKV